MGLKAKGLRTIAIGSTLCLGIIVGSWGVNLAFAKNNNDNTSSAPKYQVNESGQTYGSNMEAESIETEPDLIYACGTNGISGYVKKSDLNGDMPKTPEEAIEITRKNKSQNSREIPLYEEDGKTIIGSYKIGGSNANVIELKAEDIK